MSTPLVVVGDTLLDIDTTGVATRLSPDSPVPVVEDAVEVARPGGAGLAAVMAARDGQEVVLVTAVADDEPGRRLATLLRRVPRLTLVRLPARGRTPVKHRIRAGTRPVVRLDSGDPTAVVERVTETAVDALASASAILVSDYGRGVTGAPGVADALYDVRRQTPSSGTRIRAAPPRSGARGWSRPMRGKPPSWPAVPASSPTRQPTGSPPCAARPTPWCAPGAWPPWR
jgi:bifunctional ADP-heptose synthase (sugar kinase/adenylyltransferase)